MQPPPSTSQPVLALQLCPEACQPMPAQPTLINCTQTNRWSLWECQAARVGAAVRSLPRPTRAAWPEPPTMAVRQLWER